jgi:hypothetical protein
VYISREAIRRALANGFYQKIVAAMIVVSFLSDVLEAEVLPPSMLEEVDDHILFTWGELFFNLYAHPLTWILEPWNAVDSTIVIVTAASVFLAVGAPQIKMIR